MRYLANPLWSLETLAHAKVHYGRVCHYEVTTLLFMVSKHLYLIILMTDCTGPWKPRGRIGSYAGLQVVSIWFWLPYMGS